MLWDVPEEMSSQEKEIAKHLKRIGKFYVFLRKIRHELFDEAFQQRLWQAYAPRGTAPLPPALLAMVTLLQAYDGRGDADAVVTAKLDRRWQLVLGTLRDDIIEAPFSQGSLVRFRKRIIAAGLDQVLIERTIELAKNSGLFGFRQLKAALDSSPLIGAGRVEDTYNLIGHAMRDLTRYLAKSLGCEFTQLVEQWGLTVLAASSVKAALDVRWEDAEQRHKGLQILLGQAQRVLEHTQRYLKDQPGDDHAAKLAGILLRVIDQDTEPDPGGGRTIGQGVARERICSVGDPEMRHGRKSDNRRYNGYQRHIVRGVEIPLIFGVHVQPANHPEYTATQQLLDRLPSQARLTALWCDRGYLASPKILEKAREGMKLYAKPWSCPPRGSLFIKDDFDIDWGRRQVTCPAGHSKPFKHGGGIVRFGDQCQECPLKERCTTATHGRSIQIHPYEDVLQSLKDKYTRPRWRQRLRHRSRVEHGLAQIEQIQGRRARYKGTSKNSYDLSRSAAVVNLQALMRQSEHQDAKLSHAA